MLCACACVCACVCVGEKQPAATKKKCLTVAGGFKFFAAFRHGVQMDDFVHLTAGQRICDWLWKRRKERKEEERKERAKQQTNNKKQEQGEKETQTTHSNFFFLLFVGPTKLSPFFFPLLLPSSPSLPYHFKHLLLQAQRKELKNKQTKKKKKKKKKQGEEARQCTSCLLVFALHCLLLTFSGSFDPDHTHTHTHLLALSNNAMSTTMERREAASSASPRRGTMERHRSSSTPLAPVPEGVSAW